MAATEGPVIVSVDLGTTVTRLAQTTPARKMPVILRNTLSNESTPTLISYPDEGMRLYGEAALGKELSRPQQTATVLKQSLGLDAADAAALAQLQATGTPLSLDGSGRAVYALGDKDYSAVQLLAFYLRQVVGFATAKPTKLCLTAPVAAPPQHRAALRDAAVVAGLAGEACEVVVVDEAEALTTYMHHLQFADLPADAAAPEKVLILSVGESYTSIVAAEISQPQVTIRAVEGFAAGSSLIDAQLARVAFDAIAKKHSEDVSKHPKSHNKVRRECKKAKETLSTTPKAHVQFECLKGDIDHQMSFESKDLRDAAEPYVAQLAAAIAKAMDAAGLAKGCRVEVVGNGWRSPLIADAIKAATGAERLGHSLDSAMAVAEGAACLGAVAAAAAGASTASETPESPAPPASPTADLVHAVTIARADGVAPVPELPAADAAALGALEALERELEAADEVERERVRAVNAFESLLFKNREVPDSAFATPADATKLREFLDAEEAWLYDARDGLVDGFSTAMVVERQAAVEKRVEEEFPAVAAWREAEAAKQRAKDEELAKLARENQGEKELKSDPQRLRVAQERREQGVSLFKQEHFAEAQTRFVQALGALAELYDNTGDNKAKKDEISLSCYLNIASCSVKQGLWKIAVSNCTNALGIKPDHPKALYRRGQARAQTGELDEAKADLQRALELSGGDAAVAAELEAVNARIEAAKAKEKKMFSKMFA